MSHTRPSPVEAMLLPGLAALRLHTLASIDAAQEGEQFHSTGAEVHERSQPQLSRRGPTRSRTHRERRSVSRRRLAMSLPGAGDGGSSHELTCIPTLHACNAASPGSIATEH